MSINPELRQFYKEWYQWATTGAKQHPTFNRSQGLCNALLEWCGRDVSRYIDLSPDQKYMFLYEHGSKVHPFNDSLPGYHVERQTNSMHRNKLRLAFAKKHADG